MELSFTLSGFDVDRSFLNGYFDPIRQASTAAINDVGDLAKQRGRQKIAAAGFGKRWQNALRSEVYPKRAESVNAAAWIYHRIPYAGVFEEGATIRGKPLMWVPLSTTPKLARRTKLTPKNFSSQIGPLVSMRGGKQPLLGASVAVTKAAARRGPPYRVTRAALRRGAAGNGVIRTVPVFVGVDTVRIRKRFNLASVADQVAREIPSLYLKNLKP